MKPTKTYVKLLNTYPELISNSSREFGFWPDLDGTDGRDWQTGRTDGTDRQAGRDGRTDGPDGTDGRNTVLQFHWEKTNKQYVGPKYIKTIICVDPLYPVSFNSWFIYTWVDE